MKKFFFCLSFTLFLGMFVSKSQTPLNTAPNFNAIDARGNYHELYDYLNAGKYVLLDFFYNECLVSQNHMEKVNQAFMAFGCNTHDIIFLGINYDNTDGELIYFENEYAVHYPNISGVEGNGTSIISLFQIPAFPTLVVIAPNKNIIRKDIWPLSTINIIDELLDAGIDSIACPYASITVSPNETLYNVYPNPVQDMLTVDFSNTDSNPMELSVLDIVGKEVFTYTIQHEKFHTFDVAFLSPGIYFVRITDVNKSVYFLKFIKGSSKN